MLDFNLYGPEHDTPKDHVAEFRDAIQREGIKPPSLILVDGNIHRFALDGDRENKKDGWYVFFDDGRFAGGAFGTWKDQDKSFKWSSHSESGLSEQDRQLYRQHVEAMERVRKSEQERIQKECADWCRKAWEGGTPADHNHAYLVRKNVKPYGVRSYKDSVMIPVMAFDGSITGMQFIKPDGTKTFKTGTRKDGGFFYIGDGKGDTVVMCEGFATGASIHEATGLDVMVCFDCANMVKTARKLKGQSDKRFIVAGDNDHATQGNPGVKHATDAAEILGARLVICPRMINGTDFNDLATEQGIDSVKKTICPSANTDRYKLLNRDDIKSFPSLKWIVKGILPCRGMAQMYGASRAGKSFLSFDMGCAIAEGRDWFGYRVRKTPVVYVMLEGEGGLKQRLEAWEDHNGRQIPELFTAVTQPWGITEESDVNDLASVIPRGAVVIIDTQNRAAPMVNENSSEDMGSIIEGAKRLERMTEGVVVLVAHTGKDASKGVRGHSSQIAAVDSAIEVNRDGDVRFWKAEKVKDGVDGKDHHFKLKVIELGYDEDKDPITSCVIEVGGADESGVAMTAFESLAVLAIAKVSAKTNIIHDGLTGAMYGDCLEWFTEARMAKDKSVKKASIKRNFERTVDDLEKKMVVSIKNNLLFLVSQAHQNDIQTYRMMPNV